ncbi:unnamed protein product [Pieris macdunnoughi]|uniref:Uncharacterized protein n=1 Tax=Pieris macdunnoughi TaxID=345717 RepID=A0A821WEJ6_9NEOP|nr:unnamed protein product [Pieris macdunnoughi]
MFGLRTPTKNKPSPSTSVTDKETEAELPSAREPTLTPVNEAQTSMGEKATILSQTEESRKIVNKVYRSRITEAAALQQSALAQLNAARNLRGDIKTAVTVAVKSYAEVAAVARTEPRNDCARTAINDRPDRTGLYSLIVEPGEETEAAEDTVQKIRCSLKAKDHGFKIEKLQKIKGGKVVIGCGTEEERKRVRERITHEDNGLTVKELNNKNPLVRFKDLLKYNTIDDIKKALKTQNKATTGNLTGEDWLMTEKHRQNARNTHECHVIVQVSPGMWKALTRAQKVHIDLQRVWVEDRSPLYSALSVSDTDTQGSTVKLKN